MSEEYVVVTTISTHRMRYVIPMSKLQKMNEDCQVDPKWALDVVTMQEAEEFSQIHLGEQIVDSAVMNEKEILNLFDSDNDYLKEWDNDYKLAWIHNWKSNPTPEERESFEKLRQEYADKKAPEKQERYHDFISRMYREYDKDNTE
jgi:hypothetical protein